MSEKGSIPEGYTAINELAERAVSLMCGPWAIAPITPLPDELGETYVDDEGDGPRECRHIIRRVERAGIVISAELDNIHYDNANEEIRQLLIDRQIMAIVSHPSTGEHMQIGREYWNTDKQEITFRDGIYFAAPDPDLEGRAVYVSDNDARAFLDWMRGNMALFKELDWTTAQALGWIYTRTPYVVVRSSRFFRAWDGREQGRVDDLDAVLFVAAYMHDQTVMEYDEAKASLLSELRAGHIGATGKKFGKGDRLAILRDDWPDMRGFYYDEKARMDYTAESPIRDPGQTAWGALQFPSAKLIELWPPRFPLPGALLSGRASQEGAGTAREMPPRKRPSTGRKKGKYYSALVKKMAGLGDKQFEDLISNMGTEPVETAKKWRKALADAQHKPPANITEMQDRMKEAIREAETIRKTRG